MNPPLIVPDSEPFFIPRGPTGCLLLHGFSAMPEEMRWLGDDLAGRGHTVLGVRLAGHATHPRDLTRTRWTDWLVSVEEGLAILRGATERVVIIGQSMGGMVALVSAARYPVAGVVGISTPFWQPPPGPAFLQRLASWFRPTIRKAVQPAPPPLADRREADYPAYPWLPSRIFGEIAQLGDAMVAALPEIRVPVLLIHSTGDKAVSVASIELLHNRLGAADKEQLVLEGLDHSMVRDPKRQVVFEAVAGFIARISAPA